MGPVRSGNASMTERLDRLYESDADGNGLTADEVSDRQWERLSAADGADGTEADGVVTRAELEAYAEAKRAERADAAFARIDADGSGGITADEVSERQWQRLSAADTGGGENGEADGVVTQDELQAYREAKRAEREAGSGDEAAARQRGIQRGGFQRGSAMQRGGGFRR